MLLHIIVIPQGNLSSFQVSPTFIFFFEPVANDNGGNNRIDGLKPYSSPIPYRYIHASVNSLEQQAEI